MANVQRYHVKGMHCASCEVLIENAFSKVPGVKKVDASTKRQCATVEYEGEKPRVKALNREVRKHGYEVTEDAAGPAAKSSWWKNLLTIAGVLLGAWLLFRSGVSSSLSVNASTTLPAFLVFGLLAGFSTCAALIGGIVLAMSKQWLSLYGSNATTWEKLEPHWQFNIGRLVSYTVFGALLGLLGGVLQPSPSVTTVLTFLVSAVMVVLALQMLGVRGFEGFQIRLPKFITRRIADETSFQGKRMPFLMGALTFFLPCGFTLTAQSLALLSGNPIRGGLIMGFFALGTLPVLFAIGLTSVKLTERRATTSLFMKAAGSLVLFFSLFNVNSQLNLLGLPSLSDLTLPTASVQADARGGVDDGLPPVVNGQQVLSMTISGRGYEPNAFTVRAGVPVRWEMTDLGGGGCASAVVARNFFSDTVFATTGQTSVKEFTPTTPGKFKFTCAMGMFSGTITVVDS